MDPRQPQDRARLDPEILIAYREGRLDADRRRDVEEQLLRDGRAQAELALVDEVLAVDEDHAIPEARSERMRENLRAVLGPRRFAPRRTSPWRRRSLAVVAALAAILVLAVGVRQTFRPDVPPASHSRVRGETPRSQDFEIEAREIGAGWQVRWNEVEGATAYTIEVMAPDGRLLSEVEVAGPPWVFGRESVPLGATPPWLVRVTARNESGVLASGTPALISSRDPGR